MNAQPENIRVAIVEDVAEERDWLTTLLAEAAGFECVAVCLEGEEAMTRLPALRPDVVLMDIQMPGISGIECVRRLRSMVPETQFMMLTVVEDHDLIFRALAAGATGYLLKRTPGERLLEAIRELKAGGSPISGQVARKVIATFREPAAAGGDDAVLSRTEHEVLQSLARGMLYKEVAENLSISMSTVRTHVWHIYRKLQVHNRTEAVLKLAELRRPV